MFIFGVTLVLYFVEILSVFRNNPKYFVFPNGDICVSELIESESKLLTK